MNLDDDDDPMDQPLTFVMPVFCKGPDCKRVIIPGGPFPMTPRQVVEQVRDFGWGAKQLEKPTSWKFTCQDHSEPEPTT